MYDAAVLEPPPRIVTWRGTSYRLSGPSPRDPRLHLAAVITSLQVLGQTVFGFQVSIAQILASILTCAVIELAVNARFHRLIAWPASAMLTGNGIAFLLRVNGTRHGDWFATRGIGIFVATAAFSVVSKHLIRVKGRPLFNPSNLGLVGCFLLLGSNRVSPLDLWWGHHTAATIAVYAIILTGGVIISTRVRMVPASVAFAVTFAAGAALVAHQGHCFTARWHVGSVCGVSYWDRLVLSPELLIFLFFMITDPKTAPLGRVARIVYGSSVGVLATVLAATQRTEFGTKVAVLGALTILCLARPVLERLLPAARAADDRLFAWLCRADGQPSRVRGGARLATGLMCAISLVVAVARPTAVTVAAAREDLPVGRIDPAQIAAVDPPVAIDPAVSRLDATATAATAQAMVHDLAIDLEAIAQAIEQGDIRGAGEVVTPREMIRLRENALPQPDATTDRYVFEETIIVVVRDSKGFQSGPRLAVRGIGAHQSDGSPFDRTFMLVKQNGRFLLDGVIDTSEIRLD